MLITTTIWSASLLAHDEIRLVILDWAGTTIDFGCQAPTASFISVFAERGVVVTTAEAREPMGLHKKDHIRAMLRKPSIAARWHAAQGRDWSENDVEFMYKVVTPLQVAAAGKNAKLVPGVLECIQALRQRGIKIAASTGYFQEAADSCYQKAAEQGFVPDFTICADQVPAGRPAPWMIFRCMEAMSVYPPSAVVKIGDTVIDIEDGLNASCWSLGVVDSSNEMGLTQSEFESLSESQKEQKRLVVGERYQQAGAHGVLNTLHDLPLWLDEFQRAKRESLNTKPNRKE